MPSLDVSMVLSDPDLADTFSVRRRAETVGQNGRVATTPTLIEDIIGVITWDTGETKRRDDAQISQEGIKVVTQFSLRDESTGFQPDVIIWRGGEYTVMQTEPYRHFGEGFTSAKAVSTRATDRPAPAS